ncbi:MAG TPA: hypothetical protein VL117_05215 [Thermoleophilia bacterium]|nr:hypothetical protein [Thermoleophilia bacterium]
MTLQVDERACHRLSMKMSFPEIARELGAILGGKLVAYIGSVTETRAVRQWAQGERRPSAAVEARLRLAFRAAKCISDLDGREIAQAWFQGLNPMLDDVSPARLLREGDLERDGQAFIAAEKYFIANG